ncbi:MAG: HAD family hydrolase [Armatimonadota bacterium]
MSFKYGAIFDMDGVIIDNSDFHVLAFEEWCREKDAPFDRDYFEKHLFGKQNRDIFIALTGTELSPDDLKFEEDNKEALYRKVYADHRKPVDGLIPFLRDLKENGFGLAIATSGPPENVAFILEGVGAEGLFDAAVTCKEVTVGKPNPQVFLLAAEKLGIPPEMCAVFEDSVPGAQAAVASGSVLVGVSTGHSHLDNAAVMVADFTEISAEKVADLIKAHAEASVSTVG